MTAAAEKQRADRISGIVIALAMLAALALVGKRIWVVATGPLPPGPGVAAPVLAGERLNGPDFDPAEIAGKVVLVDFWATWCPPCRAAMPTLQKVHEAYGERGFLVLGVNQEPGNETYVRRWLQRSNVTFDSVVDEGPIAPRWGVYTFPTSFLIGRDGKIRQVYRGPAAESRLRADIEAALAEKG
jgi:thiol-disulfide isomerase/thioredoxin